MSSITSVHFLFLVFLGMLSLVLLLIIVLLIYSFNQYKTSSQASKWSEIINKKISEVIVYDGETKTDQNFTTAISNPLFRNLFLQKLVDSEKKFSGTAQDKIKSLFTEYGLKNEALKKLDQKKAHLIAGGIQELTAMNVQEALQKISAYLTHSSAQVYQEAQYAMVHFRGFEGLHFLNSHISRISEWQQLRLLLSITRIPENSEDSMKNWLKSENNSVVIFTLKLLRKFQVLSFYPVVISLLKHSSTEVRVQAVQTLLSLENSSTTTDLIEVYEDQPLEVQLEIFKIMKVLRDQSCKAFVKSQLLNHPDSGIKVYAAETLFILKQQDDLVQLLQNESSSEQLIQIIKYALQEKVC